MNLFRLSVLSLTFFCQIDALAQTKDPRVIRIIDAVSLSEEYFSSLQNNTDEKSHLFSELFVALKSQDTKNIWQKWADIAVETYRVGDGAPNDFTKTRAAQLGMNEVDFRGRVKKQLYFHLKALTFDLVGHCYDLDPRNPDMGGPKLRTLRETIENRVPKSMSLEGGAISSFLGGSVYGPRDGQKQMVHEEMSLKDLRKINALSSLRGFEEIMTWQTTGSRYDPVRSVRLAVLDSMTKIKSPHFEIPQGPNVCKLIR